jgi:hypothetical protein
VSFDFPVLSKFTGFTIPLDNQIDTLVLSYLYNPNLEIPEGLKVENAKRSKTDRKGAHSLEAYGYRLNHRKVEHEDWSQYSEAMLIRCEQDVELLEKVYEALSSRMYKIGFSEKSCEIEHRIREIIDRQTARGFWFNRVGAENLRDYLRGKESDLSIPIQKLFPPELKEVGRYTRRKRKDGSDYSSYIRHFETYPVIQDNDDDTYSCLDYVDFNIGSPVQRVERLLKLGFEPTSFTEKGNPKVDEEALLAFAKLSGKPEVGAIAEWLVCNGRANMIETWLENLKPDSRIHGRVLTCGASTRRMTHSSPNTANIPHPTKAAYGAECRSLWSVEPQKGLKLVGADASGLETVGLLHYLNNKKAEAILNQPKPNDIHSMNSRELTRLFNREIDREWGAKTSWYAWLYGAYPPKLGSIIRGTPEEGELVIKTFFKNVPGLGALIEDVQSEFKLNKGLLRTIDGGYVRCNSMNAALNYRIQSLGGIVMKLAAIILDRKRDFEWWFVGNIHDEWQMETEEKNAQRLGELAVESMTQAAEELKFRVPLTGASKVGDTWCDTH